MFSKIIKFRSEFKWLMLALGITIVLVSSINSSIFQMSSVESVSTTFLGLNLFLEILVFLAFSIFVVFGIKGFFEMYSQKFVNVIIFISGMFLAIIIFVLSYQILMIG